jgi:DNA-binding response OmpR family regulator
MRGLRFAPSAGTIHGNVTAAYESRKTTPIVVVVEDEPSVQIVLARMLRLYGFTAFVATSLEEATAAAEQNDVDAFVLDLKLARAESGADVLAWLRLQPKYTQTPVLVLTGATELSEDQQALVRLHRAHVVYKSATLRAAIEHLTRLLHEANPI